MEQNPALTKLGYPSDARVVIFHIDDVGMCHGSNRAYLESVAAGPVRTGSVMVPCPWAPEILAHAGRDPALDLGVHLTLTSEWSGYRWGPVGSRDPAGGLVDEQGCFRHRVPAVREHLVHHAAVAEMVAQIEQARRAGLDFTHLDTHMGAASIPELLADYIELGFAYRVPVLLIRRSDDYMAGLGLPPTEEEPWRSAVRNAETRGMPLVDWFRITPGHHPEGRDADRADLYETILRELPPGLTYFSLHANAPGEIETIVPERAYWRTFEYDYLRSPRLRACLAEQQIHVIGYRELRALMRDGA